MRSAVEGPAVNGAVGYLSIDLDLTSGDDLTALVAAVEAGGVS